MDTNEEERNKVFFSPFFSLFRAKPSKWVVPTWRARRRDSPSSMPLATRTMSPTWLLVLLKLMPPSWYAIPPLAICRSSPLVRVSSRLASIVPVRLVSTCCWSKRIFFLSRSLLVSVLRRWSWSSTRWTNPPSSGQRSVIRRSRTVSAPSWRTMASILLEISLTFPSLVSWATTSRYTCFSILFISRILCPPMSAPGTRDLLSSSYSMKFLYWAVTLMVLSVSPFWRDTWIVVWPSPVRSNLAVLYADFFSTDVLQVVGDEIRIMPNSRSAEILSITNNEKEVLSARPGENVNVKLRGISESNIFQGYIASVGFDW